MFKKKFKSGRLPYKHKEDDVLGACRIDAGKNEIKECFDDINKALFDGQDTRTSEQIEVLERSLEKYDLRIISLAVHTFFRRLVVESVAGMKLVSGGGDAASGLADKLKAVLGGSKDDDDKPPPTIH